MHLRWLIRQTTFFSHNFPSVHCLCSYWQINTPEGGGGEEEWQPVYNFLCGVIKPPSPSLDQCLLRPGFIIIFFIDCFGRWALLTSQSMRGSGIQLFMIEPSQYPFYAALTPLNCFYRLKIHIKLHWRPAWKSSIYVQENVFPCAMILFWQNTVIQ